jgi:ribonuclease G
VVDDPAVFERVEEFLKEYLPEEACDVTLFREKDPVFDAFGIEMEIAKLSQKKIWLSRVATLSSIIRRH